MNDGIVIEVKPKQIDTVRRLSQIIEHYEANTLKIINTSKVTATRHGGHFCVQIYLRGVLCKL